MKLKGKTALITGAASDIGRDIAFTFAREGAKVGIADLNKEAADAAAKEIVAAGGMAMGVSSEAQVTAGVKSVVAEFGGVDVLVSNAGIQIVHPLEEFSYAEWKLMLAMAWVRTALSMLTFGFTLYKVLQAVQLQSPLSGIRPNAPRTAGLTLIGIGTFALVAACVQHWRYVKKLTTAHPQKPWDLTFIVACLLALLGLLMFGSIILRSGPLS